MSPAQTGRLQDPRVRVLIVENETRMRAQYSELLNLWNYLPIIAEGEGDKLLAEAETLSKKHRCHIAIVDLRLRDDHDPNDASGMELIPKLKPTETLLVSGFSDQTVAVEAIDLGAISTLGKEEGPERLKIILERAANRLCAGRRKLVVTPRLLARQIAQDFFPGDPDLPLDEVEEVLGRLYPNARRIEFALMESQSSPGFTQAPRPRSVILKVQQDDRQPDVVKLARASKIEGEVRRYRQFIEGRLVGQFSLPLKNHAVLWDLGGAVYPFVGVTRAQTFSRFYENADIPTIEATLQRFFASTWSDLYKRPLRRKQKSVFEAYSHVWERKWYDERLARFSSPNPQNIMSALFPRSNAPDPIAWLKQEVKHHREDIPRTALATTHGDLHGDNMLVDDRGDIWAIDFERSGAGPILQDFVELEADLLNRLAASDGRDFANTYTLGVWGALPTTLDQLSLLPAAASPRLTKAMQVIAILRRLAHQCTGESDARPYLWGLMLNALFRATLLPSDEHHEREQMRALMLGSILCHRLDHWEQNWPPEHWPSIFEQEEMTHG